ncbi:hypothetical protein F5Y09DRAFT_311512 [Xylaria sp. FL1042]|nr:hypothetical protein F5Y09DRAFT_311512 [Xylaria sp. FL1042]
MAVRGRLANSPEIYSREIIVAARALRLPQILLLSGIGPSTNPARFDIPVLLDRPGVG